MHMSNHPSVYCVHIKINIPFFLIIKRIKNAEYLGDGMKKALVTGAALANGAKPEELMEKE